MSVLKIRGKNGEFHSVLTMQGADGYTPVKGVDYSDGADGKSAYEVAVEQGFVGTEAEWLTSLHGADGKDGVDGEKGDPGESGVYVGTDEPTEANVWIDPSGEPTSMVDDVQIYGTSIVADGVANIPIAGRYNFGVIKAQDVITSNRGVYISSEGFLSAYNATDKNINARESQNSISPINLDYAVKAAMCDGKGAEWTAEEQAAARERIGEPKYELIEQIVLTEDVKTIIRTTEPNGTPYNFESVLIYTNAKLASGEGSGNWGVQLTNGNTIVKNIAFGDSIKESYTEQYLKIYNNHGFLDAECYQAATNGYSYSYTQVPNIVRFNGLIEFEGITQIEVSQYNNKTFASGSVFKIYAIRK